MSVWRSPQLVMKIAVSFGVPVIVWVAGWLPLPRGGGLHELCAKDVSVGLGPIISGFLLAEVVALIVPRWRLLRTSGAVGRNALTRGALMLGAAIAVLQSWQVGVFLSSSGAMYLEGWTIAVFVLANLGWTLGLVWVARWISRNGVVNGFSVLLGAEVVSDLMIRGSSNYSSPSSLAPILFSWLLIAGTCFAIVFFLETPKFRTRKGQLSLGPPLSGLSPLNGASAMLLLPTTLENMGVEISELLRSPPFDSAAYYASMMLFVSLFAVSFCFLFCRPALAENVLGASLSKREIRGQVWRQVPWTLIFLFAIGFLPSIFASDFSVSFYASGPGLALLVAVFLDAFHECRARLRYPALSSVWAESRSYAVGPLMHCLEEAKVPYHLRSLRYHSLLQFFGPHVPIEVLVPPAYKEQAQTCLHRAMMPDEF